MALERVMITISLTNSQTRFIVLVSILAPRIGQIRS